MAAHTMHSTADHFWKLLGPHVIPRLSRHGRPTTVNVDKATAFQEHGTPNGTEYVPDNTRHYCCNWLTV